MSGWIVPLSDVRFTAEEVEAVAGVYASGWLSQGPEVARFEAAFAEKLGVPHAVAVANGTAALHLICVALGLGPGDEVVLPSLTFAATAAAVHQTGAVPVFADVRGELEPWLSRDAVRDALGPRTRAIVNVAYGGHPGEVMALRALARDHGLFLIEDAAHAVGARVDGVSVGTIGDAGAFSFYANKNLPLGEGGMLVTSDRALAERARSLRSHGMTGDTWTRHTGGATGYEVLEPGFNYRLDEPRALLGRLLLARLDAGNERRAELASRYATALEPVPEVEAVLRLEAGVQSAWHIYPLVLSAGLDRERFRGLLAANGVQTSVHYPPLHSSPAFAVADRPSLPITEDFARRTVTIPLFATMTDFQSNHVITHIVEASKSP